MRQRVEMEIALLLILCSFSGSLLVSAQTSLTDNDRRELLDAHNHFRRIVSPSASNMIKMEWSSQLEAIAQQYTQNCNFNHNPNRNSEPSSYDSVGENIYAISGAINYRAAVEAWYNEVMDPGYDYENRRCRGPDPTACLHYTQVVWADSVAVGCGVSKCKSVTDLSFNNAVLLVCNYGPSGNIEGIPPYFTGEPCSQCPTTHRFCDRKLCMATEPGQPESETDALAEIERIENESDSKAKSTKTKSKKKSKSKSRSSTRNRSGSKTRRKSGRGRVRTDPSVQSQQRGTKNDEIVSTSSLRSSDNLSIEKIVNLLFKMLTDALATN